MRHEFADKSFLEVKQGSHESKLLIAIGAKSGTDNKSFIVNCVEMDIKDFSELLNAAGIQVK